MTRNIAFTLPAVLALVGSPQRVLAQRTVLRLEDLAVAWSGGAAAPTCQELPSEAGFPVGSRSAQCSWPRVVRGRESGVVTGTRGPDGALHALTWERVVVDRAEAGRLADSLGRALRPRGLAQFACPGDGRRWQTAGLSVQFTTGAVFPDGLLRVAVFATTLPGALPDLLCPNAPKVPADPPARTRRSAAT